MKLVLGPLAAAALAMPAFAQGTMDYGSMTCADFAALDGAGMMAAAEGLQAAMASGADTSADPAGEMTADSNEAAGDADGTMAAETGGASDAPAATDTASGDMGSAAAATADAGATGGATADPMMTALTDACAADSSMTLTEAVTTAQGGMGAATD